MPKKIVSSVGGPENKIYFVEIKTPRLKKTKDGVSEPPPNFIPEEKPPVVQSDFYERQQERAQRREDYLRNGTG